MTELAKFDAKNMKRFHSRYDFFGDALIYLRLINSLIKNNFNNSFR